jgi:methylmalonyl-CoA/ethylmalonyl-CoA epimerase
MSHAPAANGLEGSFYQIGVVVRDIEVGMEHYRSLLGLGPFWRLDTHYHARYRDWSGTVANRNAFTRWGDVYLEMIEPGLGQSTASDWLKNRGEGIFHLGYAVEDMSQRPGAAECIFESFGARLPDGSAAVIHLDTIDQLGYFVELSHSSVAERLNGAIETFLAGGSAELGPAA